MSRNVAPGDNQVSDPAAPLSSQAYDSIKTILMESDGSGVGFSERHLAARTGFGLAPVRAAIGRLRTEGLIVVTPKLGITLPQLSPIAILDFYEIRMVLEAHVAGELASRGVADQLGPARESLQAQAACVAAEDAAAYQAEDMRFHMALIELHGNSEIARVLAGLRDRMRRLSSILHSGHPERMPRNHAQHIKILEAIADGDPDGARERLRKHLAAARDHVMDPHSRTRRF